jgi:hypothetical protein
LTPNPRRFPYIIDKRLLARLQALVKRTGAKVVLSSSWRLDPIGRLAAKHYGIPVYDVCPDMPKSARCTEILKWLRAHPRVSRYVVIDDEDDELDDLPVFQPSSRTGITREIIRGVENYLNGKSDKTMRANVIERIGQNLVSALSRDKS